MTRPYSISPLDRCDCRGRGTCATCESERDNTPLCAHPGCDREPERSPEGVVCDGFCERHSEEYWAKRERRTE